MRRKRNLFHLFLRLVKKFDHRARDLESPNMEPFVPDPFGNMPRVGQGFIPQEPQVVHEQQEPTLEERCIRFKDASSIKVPPLPDSAGALRQWKNSLVPMLNSLDNQLRVGFMLGS